MKFEEQKETLDLVEKYNNLDHKIIKENLFKIVKREKIKRMDIINDLNFQKEKVGGWFNRANPNVPTLQDALRLAIMYGFNIEDLVDVKHFERYGNGGNN